MPSPNRRISSVILMLALIGVVVAIEANGQPRGGVRSVTIPITIRHRGGDAVQRELQQIGELTVREDGEEQKILSIRAYGTETPISVAILIQDDVVTSISNEIKPLGEFIRGLPRGKRRMNSPSGWISVMQS